MKQLSQVEILSLTAILKADMVTYLYKYESEKTIITTANIGSRRSIHSSALGKVMVAFGTDEDLKRQSESSILAAEGRINGLIQFINENNILTNKEE